MFKTKAKSKVKVFVPKPPQDPTQFGVCCVCGEKGYKYWMEKKERWSMPPKWVTFKGLWYCPDCWETAFYARCISIPVATPLNMVWDDFGRLVAESWLESTVLHRLLVQAFIKDEAAMNTEMKKFPAYPKKLDAYQMARELAPNMHSGSASHIAKTVWAKYKRERYKVWWDGENLSNFRYPQPCIMRAQDVQVGTDVDARSGTRYPTLQGNLRGTKVIMRLKSGKDYKRSLATIDRIVAGEVKLGNVMLTGKPHHWSGHRYQLDNIKDRNEKSRNRFYVQVIARLSVHIPRKPFELVGGEVPILVRTCRWSLFTWKFEESKVFVTNGDDLRKRYNAYKNQTDPERVKRQLARLERLMDQSGMTSEQVRERLIGHDRVRRRLADDCKYMRDRKRRLSMEDLISIRSAKHQEWTVTMLRQRIAEVIKQAVRNKVNIMRYDDTEQRFHKHMPWASIRKWFAEACEANQIKFEYIGKPVKVGDNGNKEVKV